MRSGSFILLCGLILVFSCKSTADSYQKTEETLEEELDRRNRNTLPLLQRITKIPGIVDVAGAPIFQRVLNDRSRSLAEKRPLYVINGYRLGTSFAEVLATIRPNDVKTIKTYFGADASIFGPLGAYGVIEFITY